MGRVTPLLSSLNKLVITHQTPYENLQSTPTALPTAEPGTSQISYTVTAADLPSLNQTVESKIIVALMYAAGKNTDAASQTVYWRMLKNGASVNTGSSAVTAAYFWTFNAFFYDVVVGDILELRFWATAATVNWDYEARQLQVTRLALLEKYLLLLCNFTGVALHPYLTLGNPSTYSTGAFYVYHLSDASINISASKDFSPWKQNATYKLFRISRGDFNNINSAIIASSATYRPYSCKNYVPTEIQLRALRSLI